MECYIQRQITQFCEKNKLSLVINVEVNVGQLNCNYTGQWQFEDNVNYSYPYLETTVMCTGD